MISRPRTFYSGLVAAGLFLSSLALLPSCRTHRIEKIVQGAPTNQMTEKISWTSASRGTLPLLGENCCGRFSQDGREIIYLSRNRPRHRHWQVYLFNLDYHSEKRLSFHDGDDQGPRLDPQRRFFVYASLTDYIKEEPELWRQALGRPTQLNFDLGPRFLWSGRPFEIYRSTFDGQISRLTENEVFDGEAQLDAAGRKIHYLRAKDGLYQIIRQNLDSSGAQILITSHRPLGEPVLSPDGRRLAYVEFSEDRRRSQIVLADANGQKARPLTSEIGHQSSPSFSRESEYILFSQRNSAEESSHIFRIRSDGSCLTPITSDDAFETSPDLSPDGQRILVTAKIKGSWQLRLLDFHPAPCPDAEVTGAKPSPKIDP